MNSPIATPVTLVPTIICGGSGSRLWPVSREQQPKPFIRLDDGESLLQKAYLRGTRLPNVSHVMTVTNRELFFKAKDEFQNVSHLLKKPVGESYVLEPFGRNTAPAVAAAALQIAETHGENAIMLVLTADHLIADQAALEAAVVTACELAVQAKIVTFGIKPTSPETAYGYIENKGNEVICFVEKPSLDKAKDYVASGNFLWNSGMFCFTVGTILNEMSLHCPETLEATRNCLLKAKRVSGKGVIQVEMNPEDFKAVPDDSIDYAVMEKTKNVAVVACDIGWSDIGCWRALGDLTPPDANNNRIRGDVVTQDTKGCTIKSDSRMVGTVGIENLAIIDTHDALLVADKSRLQEVKLIYGQLKKQNHDTYKSHRTAQRPWGSYTVLEEGLNFKIKRIEVKPGSSLSLQMHHHRSEHWVVVSGTAEVVNGDKNITLNVNESTFIPVGNKHRLSNTTSDLLVMIEVQTGSYLGEDDIVRFQDVYGRAS